MRNSRLTWTLAVLTLAFAVSLPAEWNQWRGAGRNGQAVEFTPPQSWPKSLNKAWSLEVGEGHSSPVVSGDSVYQFTRERDAEVVRRIKLAGGEVVWRKSYPAPYSMNGAARGHGKGPKSTPLVADGRLFTLGIDGILSAWDAADGKLLWRKESTGAYKAGSPKFGAAMSPLLADGKLIVHLGYDDDGALLALDPADGGEIWRWDQDGPAYSSPIVVSVGGLEQIVTNSAKHVIGVDLASGKTLWSIPFTTPYDQNSVTALVYDDLLILSGHQQRTFAVRPMRSGASWSAEEVWTNADISMYMSSPVLVGDRLCGFTQKSRGNLYCADPRNGRPLWTGPGRMGDNALLLAVGDDLLAATTEAKLLVVDPAAAEYGVAAEYQLSNSPLWAHVGVTRDGLLAKDFNSLTYWKLN